MTTLKSFWCIFQTNSVAYYTDESLVGSEAFLSTHPLNATLLVHNEQAISNKFVAQVNICGNTKRILAVGCRAWEQMYIPLAMSAVGHTTSSPH